MHNINIIGLISSAMYCAWINTTSLNISDRFWFDIVCKLAEASWQVIKCARAYSILILSIFRLVAVLSHEILQKMVSIKMADA